MREKKKTEPKKAQCLIVHNAHQLFVIHQSELTYSELSKFISERQKKKQNRKQDSHLIVNNTLQLFKFGKIVTFNNKFIIE